MSIGGVPGLNHHMKATLSKPYDLAFEQRDGYLYACAKSPSVTYGTALDYLAEIAEKCAEVRCKRLLIERDIPAMMPTPDGLRALKEFLRMSTGVRIAFVNRHASVGTPLKELIETAAVEGADISYFDNVAAAEEWLLR